MAGGRRRIETYAHMFARLCTHVFVEGEELKKAEEKEGTRERQDTHVQDVTQGYTCTYSDPQCTVIVLYVYHRYIHVYVCVT